MILATSYAEQPGVNDVVALNTYLLKNPSAAGEKGFEQVISILPSPALSGSGSTGIISDRFLDSATPNLYAAYQCVSGLSILFTGPPDNISLINYSVRSILLVKMRRGK